MPSRIVTVSLSTGAVALAAVLAGCSSSGPAEAASGHATTAAAAEAPGSATAAAPGAQQGAADTDADAAGDAAHAAAVTAGGRCDIGQRYTTALVVGGAVDCATLGDVWAGATADPAFAVHGNRNTIVVGDWTCRAHQTRPVQTGYCENTVSHDKFKVIHT